MALEAIQRFWAGSFEYCEEPTDQSKPSKESRLTVGLMALWRKAQEDEEFKEVVNLKRFSERQMPAQPTREGLNVCGWRSFYGGEISTKESFRWMLHTEYPSKAVEQDLEFQSWFDERADRWEKESGIHSSPGAKFINQNYISIMAKGERVVPLILKRLETSKKDWLWALENIIDEDENPGDEWMPLSFSHL